MFEARLEARPHGFEIVAGQGLDANNGNAEIQRAVLAKAAWRRIADVFLEGIARGLGEGLSPAKRVRSRADDARFPRVKMKDGHGPCFANEPREGRDLGLGARERSGIIARGRSLARPIF